MRTGFYSDVRHLCSSGCRNPSFWYWMNICYISPNIAQELGEAHRYGPVRGGEGNFPAYWNFVGEYFWAIDSGKQSIHWYESELIRHIYVVCFSSPQSPNFPRRLSHRNWQFTRKGAPSTKHVTAILFHNYRLAPRTTNSLSTAKIFFGYAWCTKLGSWKDKTTKLLLCRN